MKAAGILLLALAVSACGAAVGDTNDERLALQMEVNEALTLSHLRSLVSAETQAQSLRIVDTDEDGIGEFTFVKELAGQKKVRGPGEGLKFSLLGGDFKSASSLGYVQVHGYLYRDFLPGEDGVWVSEAEEEVLPVSADLAESHWVCYAWPVTYGTTGRVSFFVDSEGTIYRSDQPELTGRQAPAADAALAEGEGLDREIRPEWQKVD